MTLPTKEAWAAEFSHVDGDLFVPPTPPQREQRVWKMPPGEHRSKERSRTYPGIAAAMAAQWSAFICRRV